MAGKQAKILSDSEIEQLLRLADQTRNPLRNRCIVLLSAKAGLRAAEIAGLTWEMLADAQGRVGQAERRRLDQGRQGVAHSRILRLNGG